MTGNIVSKLGLWVGYSLTQYYFFLSCLLNCCIKTSHSLLNISTLVISIVMSHLMVRFSITSGKVSSSAFSSSNVMEPLLSLSADSNSASVRSSSFSSGSEIALSRRQDFRTVRNSSGSMEPLPTWLDSIKNNASYMFLDQHSLLFWILAQHFSQSMLWFSLMTWSVMFSQEQQDTGTGRVGYVLTISFPSWERITQKIKTCLYCRLKASYNIANYNQKKYEKKSKY